MEGGSLFNPGFLGASFSWWVGQVVDDSVWRDNISPSKYEDKNSVPGWGYRYKVRIIGLHDQGQETIPDDQLPWANIMYPVTAGAYLGSSGQTPMIRQGNMVFGFFLDGQDQQVPVIMGVMGNNSQTILGLSADNKVTNTNPGTLAFSGHATGAVPKEGSKRSIPSDEDKGIKKPAAPKDPREDARDREDASAEADRQGLTGKEKKNFIDRFVERRARDFQRCQLPSAPTFPGATNENEGVHQINSADVKRQEKCDEKIVLLTPDQDEFVKSALKGIQTALDNYVTYIDKFLQAIQCYVDAVSSTITDLRRILRNIVCEIAKYIKVLFDQLLAYVLKILNKELNKVIAAMPSSYRYQFADMKDVLTELMLCLYGKLSANLCDKVQGVLDDILNLDQLEKDARDRARGEDSGATTNPKVPMCSAEDVASRILAASKSEIDAANNNLIENLDAYLEDIQQMVAGISQELTDLRNVVGDVSGSITSALNFFNFSTQVFGCELAANRAPTDYYTFCKGGDSTAPAQLPSSESVDAGTNNQTEEAKPVGTQPFVEPTRATKDVDRRTSGEQVTGPIPIEVIPFEG
jgi:hypothetical protein